MSERPRILYVEGPYSSVHFPYRAPRLRERFRAFGLVTEGFALPGEPISDSYDLGPCDFVCYFGGRTLRVAHLFAGAERIVLTPI